MPYANVPLTNGESVEFFVPEGTSVEQANAMAPEKWQERALGVDILAPPPEPDRTLFGLGEEGMGYAGEVGAGLASGALGLLGSAATGASFLLPEEQEQAARTAIQDITEAAQAPFAPKRGYEDTITRMLAEGLGSTAPFLATAPFGIPGLLAGVGVGAAAGSGEAAQRAMAEGATEEQISKAAGLGLLPGLGETVVPYGIGRTYQKFKKLKDAVGQEAATNIVARLNRIGTAAGSEGLQEASAEIAQNLIAQGVYNPDTGAFANTEEAFGLGAGVGGLLQGLMELAIRRPRGGGTATEETEGAEEETLLLPPPADYVPDSAFPINVDGQVVNNREEYDARVKELQAQEKTQRDIANSIRWNDPATAQIVGASMALGVPASSGVQGELFGAAPPAPAPQQGLTPDEQDMQRRLLAAEGQFQQQLTIEDAIRESEIAQAYNEQAQTDATVAKVAGETGPQPPTAMGLALSPIAEQLFGKDAQNRGGDVGERVSTNDQVFGGPVAGGPLSGNIVDTEQRLDDKERKLDRPPAADIDATSDDRADGPTDTATEINETLTSEEATDEPKRKQGAAKDIKEEVDTLIDVQLTPKNKDDVDKFKISQTTMVEKSIPVMKGDIDAISTLAERKSVREAGPIRAANLYSRGYSRLNLPPNDIANVTVRAMAADAALNDIGLSESEIKEINVSKRMENGANAGVWVSENLSPEGIAAFNEQRKEFARDFRSGKSFINRVMDDDKIWERRYNKIRQWDGVTASQLKALENKHGKESEKFAGPFDDAFTKAQQGIPKSELDADEVAEDAQTKKDEKLATTATMQGDKFAKKVRGKEETAQKVRLDKDLVSAQKALTKATKDNNTIEIKKATKKVKDAQEALKALDVSPEILSDAERQRKYEEIKAANLEQYQLLENLKKKYGGDSREFITAFDIAYQNYLENLSGRELKALDEYIGSDGTISQLDSSETRSEMGSRGGLLALGYPYNLPKSAILATLEKVPRRIENAISNGKIKRVYQLLAESKNPLVARVARGILQNIGSTSINANLPMWRRYASKHELAGAFDPKTNTIYINTEGDVSVHTLLHEGSHAVLSHVIDDNPQAPAVQQLQKIYDNVKDALSSAYGAESLQEFVAEFYTNPRFREEVASIPYQTVKGEPLTAFQKALDALRRLFNWFILKTRFKAKTIKGKGVSDIDSLIDSIMSPAPDTRDAPLLKMTFKEIQKSIDDLGKQAGLGKITKGQRKESIELTRNYLKSAPSKARQLLNSFMPLNVLVEMYRKDFTEGPIGKTVNALEDLFILIKEKVGKRQKKLAQIKDTGKQVRALLPDEKEKENLNAFISETNLARLDGSADATEYTRYWAHWEKSTGKFRTDAKGNKLGLIYTKEKQDFDTAAEREAFILNNNLSNKAIKTIDKDLTRAKKAHDLGADNEAEIITLQKKLDAAKATTEDIRGLQRSGGKKEQIAEHKKLHALWNKLKPDTQKAFKILQKSHEKQLDDTLMAMDDRLAAYTTNLLERKTMGDKIFELMRGKERIPAYFPFYREGTVWLSYKLKGDPEPRKMLFKDEAQRDWYISKLEEMDILDTQWEKTGYTVGSQLEGRNSAIDKLSTGVAFSIMQDLKKAKAPKEVQDNVLEALLNSMPEKAVAQIFRTREGVLGFETDHVAVFEKAMPSRVMNLLNLEYDVPISEVENRIKKRVDELSPDNPDIETFYNETITQYTKFIRNPDLATWSKALKSAGFAATLGVNVSSVLVNATNLPIVVFPYLGGKYGYGKAGKAMNTARKVLLGTPRKRKMVNFLGEELDTEVWDGPSLVNVNWNDPNLSPELKRYKVLAEMLVAQGQANRSTVADNIDMDNPSNNAWTAANNISGFMFHQGERFNRQITAIAAYDLELARIKAGKKGGRLTQADYTKAANQAMLDIDLTNSGAMTETAPTVAQGSVGSVLMMYKRFGISMYALQFKMAKEALKNALPAELKRIADAKYKGDESKLTDADRQKAEATANEIKRVAKRQIVGLFATSGLMAGVQGLPLYGLITFVANTVFLDDEDDDADTIAARFFGEGLYSGAINALTNLDVAPRIGMTNLVYRTLPNKTDQHMVLDFLEMVGGPVYGVGKRAMDGMAMVGEGEVQRGIEKMLPSFASNPLKAYRYGTEGANTLRGDPITENLSWWNVGAQAMGLVPASYTKQLELSAVEKRKERVKNEKRSDLLRDYYFALRERDSDEMADILEDIGDYNARNPNFSINGSTIARSIAGHLRTTEEVKTTGGVTYSRRNRADVQRRNAEALGIDFYDIYS